MAFKALGRVTVAAAGTPVALYAGKPLIRAAAVIIQARSGNVGTVYIGDVGMVKGTGVAVAAELAPGQSTILGGGAAVPINPENLFVDADNNNDAINVSVVWQ